jgi:DNA-binding IscR family transcriptional regulator
MSSAAFLKWQSISTMQIERNINYGWAKLPRHLLDWKHIKNINAVYLYAYLLLSADTETGSVEVSIRGLAEHTGLSVQNVRTILNLLEREGMVTRELTHKVTQQLTQGASVITICDLADYDAYESASQHSNQHSIQHTNQHSVKEVSPHTPLLENNKENKKKILSKDNIKEKKESFVAPEFETAFSAWLEYKKHRGQTYKDDKSKKICYNKLVKLSGSNPETAMAIVEQSMANNWAGLFALQEENGNGNNPQRKYEQSGQVFGRSQEKNPLVGYSRIIE